MSIINLFSKIKKNNNKFIFKNEKEYEKQKRSMIKE